MIMMENIFEQEFDKSKLEQVETGVFLEHCDPVGEAEFRETDFQEDYSDLMFGRMEIPSHARENDDPVKCGIIEQLYRVDLLKEIPALSALLPPACGTSSMDFEYLLETQEFSCDLLHDASLVDITESLAQDCRVLCKICVDSFSKKAAFFSTQESFCMVEVLGIDLRDPNATKVCFESFGSEYSVRQCPLDVFMKAWSASNCTCYVIYRE